MRVTREAMTATKTRVNNVFDSLRNWPSVRAMNLTLEIRNIGTEMPYANDTCEAETIAVNWAKNKLKRKMTV